MIAPLTGHFAENPTGEREPRALAAEIRRRLFEITPLTTDLMEKLVALFGARWTFSAAPAQLEKLVREAICRAEFIIQEIDSTIQLRTATAVEASSDSADHAPS